MRSIISSACFISPMDSSRMCLASRFSRQLSHIMAWTKYWLIAVSSAQSTSLSTLMTSASPFNGTSGARNGDAADVIPQPGSEGRGEVLQEVGQAGGAVLAAAAPPRGLLERAP